MKKRASKQAERSSQGCGTKRGEMFWILRERFPAGQFRFGDAVEAYREGERRLFADGLAKRIATQHATNVRDALLDAGAFFAELVSVYAPWPRTNQDNLVTLREHCDYERLQIEREITEIEGSLEATGYPLLPQRRLELEHQRQKLRTKLRSLR